MNFYIIILIFMYSLVSHQLHAKVNPIQTEPLGLIAELSFEYTDNYHPRAVEGVSVFNTSLGLSGKLLSQHEAIWLQASYSGHLDRYHISENKLGFEDTFVEYDVQLLSRIFISNSFKLDLFVDKKYKDEFLGTGISSHRTGVIEADSYDIDLLGGRFYFGRKQGAHHISIGYFSSEQRYDSPNIYASLFEIDKGSADFEYTYRISEYTSFDINLEYQNTDYIEQSIPDSELYQILAGFVWQGTGKSKITALLGAYQRSFLVSESNQGFVWQLNAEYQLSERLTLKVATSRNSQDATDEQSQSSLVSNISGQVIFQYREHIILGAEFSRLENKLEQEPLDILSVQRELSSNQSTAGLSVAVNMRTQSKLTLKIQNNKVEDDVLPLDYSENKVELNWRYEF